MAEALIDELVRTGASDARSVRAIRASLRIFMDKLAKLQGFYSGLSEDIPHLYVGSARLMFFLSLMQGHILNISTQNSCPHQAGPQDGHLRELDPASPPSA